VADAVGGRDRLAYGAGSHACATTLDPVAEMSRDASARPAGSLEQDRDQGGDVNTTTADDTTGTPAKWTQAGAMALAACAGAVDLFAVAGLRGAFAGVITGKLVTAGLVAGTADPALLSPPASGRRRGRRARVVAAVAKPTACGRQPTDRRTRPAHSRHRRLARRARPARTRGLRGAAGPALGGDGRTDFALCACGRASWRRPFGVAGVLLSQLPSGGRTRGCVRCR
jgi:hypothetical protein